MNQVFFPFYRVDLLLSMSLFSLAVLVITTAFLALLKGKVFDIGIGLILAVSLGLFIQGNYLNIDLGRLDGALINWDQYQNESFWNLLIWLLIIFLIVLIFVIQMEISQATIYAFVLPIFGLIAGIRGVIIR